MGKSTISFDLPVLSSCIFYHGTFVVDLPADVWNTY